jgi:hypothetical protein
MLFTRKTDYHASYWMHRGTKNAKEPAIRAAADTTAVKNHKKFSFVSSKHTELHKESANSWFLL